MEDAPLTNIHTHWLASLWVLDRNWMIIIVRCTKSHATASAAFECALLPPLWESLSNLAGRLVVGRYGRSCSSSSSYDTTTFNVGKKNDRRWWWCWWTRRWWPKQFRGKNEHSRRRRWPYVGLNSKTIYSVLLGMCIHASTVCTALLLLLKLVDIYT